MIALLLAGCEPFGPGAGDPETPLGAGELSVSAPSLDLGVVSAGQGERATGTFTAQNLGESPLVVAGLHQVVGDDAFSTDADAIVTLDPGEELLVSVTFAPRGDADFSAQLLPNGMALVELSGVGEAPSLSVSSELLSLANSPVGCEDEATLELLNGGRETLVISDIALAGSEDLLLHDDAERVLEPGASTSVALGFEPTSGGQHAASLTVESNDPESPIVSVSVEGLGYEGGIVDEQFAYLPRVEADVLWVIDSGAATAGRLSAAASQVDVWLDALDEGLVDWHQAVVNHDVACQATDSAWLGVTSSDSADELAEAFVYVGDGGTELLELAQSAVERTDDFDCLDGLLRHGAQLHVVLVTARGEASGGDVDDYLDALESRLDGAELVVSSVAGDGGAGCGTATAALTASSRTGGYVGDLCTGSFLHHFAELAAISRATSEVRFEHELGYTPVPETIVVSFDGEPLDDWSLGADGVTITVVGGETFGLGAMVDVTYVQAVPCSE